MNDKIFIVCIELNTKSAIMRFENSLIGKDMPFKIIEGTYGIRADYTATSSMIRDIITSIFGNQCVTMVLKAGLDVSWKLLPEAEAWMKENL